MSGTPHQFPHTCDRILPCLTCHTYGHSVHLYRVLITGRRLQGQRFVVYGAGIALSSLYCGGWSPILEYGCSGGGEFVDLEIASVDGVAESRILCGPSNGGGRCILPPGEPTRNRPSENLGVVVAFACVGTTTSQFAAFSRALGQGLRCTSTGSNFNAAVLLASLQYANSGQASSSAVTCRSGSYNSNGFCSDDDACIDFGTSGVCSVPLSTVEAVVRSIPSSFVSPAKPKPTLSKTSNASPTFLLFSLTCCADPRLLRGYRRHYLRVTADPSTYSSTHKTPHSSTHKTSHSSPNA